MKLFYSAASPYARKVLVAAHETGLADRIELVATAVKPIEPNRDYAKQNPLMKVPCLIAEGGESLYDSRVIVEYLDTLHSGRKLIPAAGGARWRALRLQALGDGIADAGILVRYEAAMRPVEKQYDKWVEGQSLKALQGLDAVEADSESLKEPVDVGQIAVACAIGWFEFRNVLGDLRKGRPKLFAWYDAFAKRPSMQATAPKG